MSTLKPADKALLPNNGILISSQRDPRPEVYMVCGWTPEIGDRKTWIPAAFEAEHQQGLRSLRSDAEAEVTGTVVYVNHAHRWYRVMFELPGGVPAFECFTY